MLGDWTTKPLGRCSQGRESTADEVNRDWGSATGILLKMGHDDMVDSVFRLFIQLSFKLRQCNCVAK